MMDENDLSTLSDEQLEELYKTVSKWRYDAEYVQYNAYVVYGYDNSESFSTVDGRERDYRLEWERIADEMVRRGMERPTWDGYC